MAVLSLAGAEVGDPPVPGERVDAGLLRLQAGDAANVFPSLFNLSTRVHVGDGDGVLIGGFVIRGDEPKRILIRARGPSLADAGVQGVLNDPTLRLFSGGVEIGFNDDWKDSQQAEIEATGRAPDYDEEAALIATLEPGPYTVHVRDAADIEGIAILEVIGIDEEPDIRLFNVSSRARVGVGAEAAIGGFVIRGVNPKQVLLRARGPSIGGVPPGSTLADPTLELYSGATSLAFNDDWQDSADAAAIAATGRAPAAPSESAILATLGPGPYTAILRGAEGGSGVGIVEVIAVDDDFLPFDVYRYRMAAGVPVAAFDTTLNGNCWQHARYMAENNHLTHTQNGALPFSSPAGQTCAENGNVWLGSTFPVPYWTVADSIAGWMGSVGHRLWLLYPTTQTFGYGFYTAANNRAGAALDVLSMADFSADTGYVGWPVRYPAPGQTGVPAAAYPITVNWRYFGVTPVVSGTALTTAGGVPIAHSVSTSLPAGHKGLQIVPGAALPDNTVFNVSVQGTYGGAAFLHAWQFATGNAVIP